MFSSCQRGSVIAEHVGAGGGDAEGGTYHVVFLGFCIGRRHERVRDKCHKLATTQVPRPDKYNDDLAATLRKTQT